MRQVASFGTAPTAAQLEGRLGYFDGFMRAWGAADPATRAAVYTETSAYSAGRVDADTEVRDVSGLLGLAVPAGW